MSDIKKQEKDPSDIRIKYDSRVSSIIRYCNTILKEKKVKHLKFSAVGSAIGKLVNAVEVLKLVNPGLYQSNKLATVSFQRVDNQTVENQKLFPKMEIILSLDPLEKNEGYQEKLDENERERLFKIFTESPRTRRVAPRRGGFRARRGGFRGRGRGRGFRAPLRPRGGFRRPTRGRGFRAPLRPRGGFRGTSRGRGLRGGRGFGPRRF